MGSLCFRTRTHIFRASSLSTFIRSDSRRASCGATKPRPAIQCTWICGILTSIMSDQFSSLPLLPRDESGPVFAEPWQAQAFAMAVTLSAEGHFTWKEWAAVLADELKAAAGRGEPGDGSRYYEHWLAALERLVTEKSLFSRTEMLERKDAWADAYRHTPHGKPVVLRD